MVRLRTLVQTLVALGTNAYLLFPFGGSVIYQGPLKAVCHPGLNCYSCPGALLSCPVGAVQNFLASIRFYTPGTIPHFGAIVVAYVGFIGTLVGRLPCGWLCPFGFIQDLIHKIPARKFSVWEPLRWGKYAVLVVLVIILPLWLVDAATGLGHPWFCKLLCPAGTLEGALPMIFLKPSLWAALGFFFWFKLSILSILLILMVFVSRPFCRMLCPLGAFYSLFSRMTLVQLEFIEGNCVECGSCARKCPMGVKPQEQHDSKECIMCLKCLDACQFRALQFGIRRPAAPDRKRTASPI